MMVMMKTTITDGNQGYSSVYGCDITTGHNLSHLELGQCHFNPSHPAVIDRGFLEQMN